jgi:hypothetical protein
MLKIAGLLWFSNVYNLKRMPPNKMPNKLKNWLLPQSERDATMQDTMQVIVKNAAQDTD